MKTPFVFLILVSLACLAFADASVLVPDPAGSVGNPADAASTYPFLLQQTGQPGGQQTVTSMRYQQIYGASAFSAIDSGGEYITHISFALDESVTRPTYVWSIPNIQISLSTTPSAVDSLSPVFANNVGVNDTTVYGPGQLGFFTLGGRVEISLNNPFLYNPASGNLLLDVRVFDGTGPFDMFFPTLNAQNSSTDQVARIYATSVGASSAEVRDSLGLFTVFETRAVPEPSSLVLFLLGGISIFAFARTRTRRN